MKQVIRIVGGKYRGKKIYFPSIKDLRPTPDRVRETLFNWLMHDIKGKRCLDLFAGSGALGFEALSRGAAEVVLVEQSPKAYATLLTHRITFNEPSLKVVNHDGLKFLQETTQPFDIVFLDPPFSKDFLSPCLKALEEPNILSAEGMVYIESPEQISPNESTWTILKLKQYGHAWYGLLRKTNSVIQTDEI
jgi:16S rRNA (guanine966-N2)-methyltransferase